MTVKDRDKLELMELAEDFEKLGYSLYATGKTAKTLNTHGIATNAVKKIGEGSPNLLDLLESGNIKMVINTPTRGREPERDGFKIRRKAVEMSVPCLTSIDTAKAILSCLKLEDMSRDIDVISLSDL